MMSDHLPVRCLLFLWGVVAVSLLPATANAVNWNILDRNYGNAAGEVTFHSSESDLFNTPRLAETPSAGKTTLTMPIANGMSFYAGNTTIPGMTTGNTDVTIEFKAALPGNTPMVFYISETNDLATSKWNHVFMINRLYPSTPTPNVIADYNARKEVNSAPAGFNGAAPHVYRLVRAAGVTSLYLDNNPKPLISPLASGAGAAADHVNYEFGFTPSRDQAAPVEMYYFRIASGAHVPTGVAEPDTTPVQNRRTGGWRHDLQTKLANVGGDKQLLIDDVFFDKASGIQFSIHPPHKTGETTLGPDKPWEDATLNWFSVMQDGGKYRMWYECYDVAGWPTGDDTSFCYAESTDAIHWTKPNLGLFEYHGVKETNILFRLLGEGPHRSRVHGVGIFKDPNAPAESRYKAASQGVFANVGKPPQRIAGMYSPDGLHWTRYPEPICMDFADSQDSVFWDESLSKYVLYGRVSGHGRALGRSESNDFAHFPPLKLVLQTDDADPPKSDLYNSAAIKYPFAANAYLMFPSLYQQTPGTLDIRLAVSRDGIHWSWPQQDKAFIPLGKAGEFDSASLYMGQGILPMGDNLWQYYSGSPLKHDEGELENLRKPGNARLFSRVVERLDGYVSADANAKGGSFTTIPLTFSGNILKLNVSAHAGGSVRVGLLDGQGNPVAGHSLDDCVPITGDHLDTIVRWKDGADVTSQAGKPTRLIVEMKNASLYAFQFTVGYAGAGRDH
jgi:hypothetical protein